MSWPAALAIYALFWVMTAFFILPFHARKVRSVSTKTVAGEDRGAPPIFLMGWAAAWTTLWASAIFVLYYLAYTNRWIDLAALTDGLGPQ